MLRRRLGNLTRSRLDADLHRGKGLAGLGMWSLGEDRNGNLWIGSDDAGVMRLAHGGFRRFDAMARRAFAARSSRIATDCRACSRAASGPRISPE